MVTPKPNVTVYVISHNYGQYLTEAVQSVVSQTRGDWELIVIDDGSQDNTAEVARNLCDQIPDRARLIVHAEPRGLQSSANEALELARGQYIMRLDADDYLDDNALLVLGHHLDSHPDVALVYSSYVYVDERGNHLGVQHHRRSLEEGAVRDQPAHGACALIRRRALKAVGGYDESHDRQDGYELWLKLMNRFAVAEVTTPLWYYRQHAHSLSVDQTELLKARAGIKRAQVIRGSGSVSPRVAAVIGAKNTYEDRPNIVLAKIAEKPLIDHTLSQAISSGAFEQILVSTDDQAVIDYCREQYPEAACWLRPPELSEGKTTQWQVLSDAVDRLEVTDVWPDILVFLNIHSPLRRPHQIQEAIDTLLLYGADSVISVCEDQELYYVPGAQGLEPLNPAMHHQIKVDRETLYVSNGAIQAVLRDVISPSGEVARKMGHIIMPRSDSLQIKSAQDAWLVEQILLERSSGSEFAPKSWRPQGVG